jgi:hypothetical protein
VEPLGSEGPLSASPFDLASAQDEAVVEATSAKAMKESFLIDP